ncbi:hypothetical protein [Saccharibacillus sp. JS10]|uniref:hypothetical protein n=1 Tax=Saccharibacillus sp. JS10 TaxID=2950552 RepID=UPI00210A8550|nr:hypothetical protein [Saccharibacillus sp. JS10]MCQ4085819.1 hypothetical protein [Saccharibacillus sp. JS10]
MSIIRESVVGVNRYGNPFLSTPERLSDSASLSRRRRSRCHAVTVKGWKFQPAKVDVCKESTN